MKHFCGDVKKHTKNLSLEIERYLSLVFLKSGYIFRDIREQFGLNSRVSHTEDNDSFKGLLRKTEKLEEAFIVMAKYSDNRLCTVLVKARSKSCHAD